MRKHLIHSTGLFALVMLSFPHGLWAQSPQEIFDQRVAPIFAGHCLECHNATAFKGNLDLSQSKPARKGGESGIAIVPKDLKKSLLWERVSNDEMPPKHPLTPAEKQTLKTWIEAGANWGSDPIDPFRYTSRKRAGYDWWALQALSLKPPEIGHETFGRNPIDAFILAGLKQKNLSPGSEAKRRVLIRRLSFDLRGLPPIPLEVQTFLADRTPDAYECLVDRFLSSPQFGERWARHWLDLARFGESQGFERDKLRTNSWRYRDWVIDSLNNDLPYDDFARRQLAGDVLFPNEAKAKIATGFLVAGAYDEVGQKQQSAAMKAVVRQDELEDVISVVGQTFLGLTINCARCHDHKFDPITQKEYYQFAAALAGVRHGQPKIASQELSSQSQRGIDGLAAAIRQLESELQRIEQQKNQQRLTEIQFEIAQLRSQQARYREQSVYAVAPRQPPPTHLLARGNTTEPQEVVTANGIASLHTLEAEFGLKSDAPEADRRKHLAHWITHPENPLFARAIVNRLWQHHFGAGLVPTPSDLGFNGARPSHPELLDFLAGELIRNRWSLKAVHRLIVTSATYRQSSQLLEANFQTDADNRLLWRKSPRRLEAEALRDAMLAVSGQFNEKMHGPGYHDFRTFTANSQFYVMLDPVGNAFNRRSLYRTWVRSGRSGFLDVFDCPDPSAKAPNRPVTTTPLQALSLLNNSFAMRMADQFANRVLTEVGTDTAQQVNRIYELAYARTPNDQERNAAVSFVKDHGLSAFCRVVFNSNEFLYVD